MYNGKLLSKQKAWKAVTKEVILPEEIGSAELGFGKNISLRKKSSKDDVKTKSIKSHVNHRL
jgi:hypothetical protein